MEVLLRLGSNPEAATASPRAPSTVAGRECTRLTPLAARTSPPTYSIHSLLTSANAMGIACRTSETQGGAASAHSANRCWLPASFARPWLDGLSLGDWKRHGGGCGGRVVLTRRPRPDGARRGVWWECDAAPAWPHPPASWVGWSLAPRPRAVTPRERPEDPPAWGDRYPARLGDGDGPQLQLLAQARRRPSVHPTDLRLALPGLPRSRAAVLQPRRPAVSGARHRAAGGGTGPAVAGQGGGQAPHRAQRRGP
jgi:hypothetical protein